MPNPMW